MRRHRALVLLALAAAVARADDTVDLQVRGNEKVQGTLRPADERENFLLAAPMGAVITASVKALSTDGPVPQLDLVDDTPAVRAVGAVKGRGAKLAPYTVESSRMHAVRVFGDGELDGDYQLKVKMTPRKSWLGESADPLAPATEMDFEFHAPSNCTCSVDFYAGIGSPITPRIIRVDGPDGFTLPVAADDAKPFRHKATGLRLGGFGAYKARIRNDGAFEGDWRIKVTLAFPKVKKTNVDIRDTSLTGAFGGAQLVFGRVVDGYGGPVDPGATGGPLAGASITVPSDALADPAVIAITTAETFFVNDDDHPGGVAVAFSPSGTTFAQDVTVTIPFDLQSYDDPSSEMTIYIEDGATGSLSPAAKPYTFDVASGSVSFQTSHFSRYEGTSQRDRPCRGEYLQFELGGGPSANFGGSVGAGLHAVTFQRNAPGGKTPVRTGNAYSMAIDRRVVTYVPGPSGSVGWSPLQFTDSGTVAVTNDETIDVNAFALTPFRYLRGRNEDVLLVTGGGSGGGSISALLRRTKGRPTPKTLSGAWQAFAYEFAAAEGGNGVGLRHTGRAGRLLFERDGTVRATGATSVLAALAPSGGWDTKRFSGGIAPGTFKIGTDLTDHSFVDLEIGLGDASTPTVTRLYPVLRGEMLLGIEGAPQGPAQDPTAAFVRAVLLVRVAEDASPELLRGRSIESSFGFAPAIALTARQEISWTSDDVMVVRDGVKALTATGISRAATHAPATGAPTANSMPVDAEGAYKVLRDGTYVATGYPEVGAVTESSGFYVTARFGESLFALGFGTTARAVAPTAPK
jgi:hypothetical protein